MKYVIPAEALLIHAENLNHPQKLNNSIIDYVRDRCILDVINEIIRILLHANDTM